MLATQPHEGPEPVKLDVANVVESITAWAYVARRGKRAPGEKDGVGHDGAEGDILSVSFQDIMGLKKCGRCSRDSRWQEDIYDDGGRYVGL